MVLLVLVLLALLGACGTLPPPPPGSASSGNPPQPSRDAECGTRPASVTADSLTVALPDSVDPAHAPLPQNESERFLFSQFYETLVVVDCNGRIRPSRLVQSITRDARQGLWRLSLSPDARFWDGSAPSATDILAAWRDRDATLAEGAAAIGVRDLVVSGGDTATLMRLALPRYSVTKSAPAPSWPMGTGAFRPAGAWHKAASEPVLAVRRVGPRLDPRDALDQGVDLLITADVALVGYAVARSPYRVVPLDWNRRYILVTPPGSRTLAAGLDRDDLTRAVHAVARAAPLGGCAQDSVTDGAHPAGDRWRLFFDSGDGTARDLAERLVGSGALERTVAVAVDSAGLAAARRTIPASLVVTAVPSLHEVAGCDTIPLIETRRFAVIRPDVLSFRLGEDGSVLLEPAAVRR